MAGIGDIADRVGRVVGTAQDGVAELLFEPVIRLGVTGLSRAGKTVFITSLVANLLNRGRMPQFLAHAEGRVRSVYLQPQPDDSIPRFAYEDHLAALTGPAPHWPESTRAISQLRLSLKVRPAGLLAGVTGLRTVHLDIVDYPGEWLLDLPLMDQSFADWSAASLELARQPGRAEHAAAWLALLESADGTAALDETTATDLARAFTTYLSSCREAGLSAVSPGRFLMPGDLLGSPALTFAPLPPGDARGSKTLYGAFDRRFEAYKRLVVKPFFRDHFARIDRQVVLIDALGAINAGPRAVEDLRGAMADVLACFRPGRNSWLSTILGKRVERILFAASKADHLHHTQHPQLTGLLEALLREARERAAFKGAETEALALAGLRATVEQTVSHEGEPLDCVRGTLLDSGKAAAFYPGDLPSDPAQMMSPARKGAEGWLDRDFQIMRFAPPVVNLRPGEGPPHIRMDRAVEFLIGDRLR